MIPSITGYEPFDLHIMQSQSDADRAIRAFRVAIENGMHPEEAELEVWRQTGINPANLMDYDKQRINRAVENIYRNHSK